MISRGTGGGNTITGLNFEKEQHLAHILASLPGYRVADDEVFFSDKKVAIFLEKNKLYKFLSKEGVDFNNILSSKLLPDEALLVDSKTLYIIEKKFQQCPGSVDEKLQTCDFKKKQYKKLVKPLGWEVEFFYVLSDWFKNARYKDVLEYINEVGCKYFFREISIAEFHLPIKTD
jgi:hypothetical protein